MPSFSTQGPLAWLFMVCCAVINQGCGTEVGNGNQPDPDETTGGQNVESVDNPTEFDGLDTKFIAVLFNSCSDIWSTTYESTQTYKVETSANQLDTLTVTQDENLSQGTLSEDGSHYAYDKSNDRGGYFAPYTNTITDLAVTCTETQFESLSEFAGESGSFASYSSEVTLDGAHVYLMTWIIEEHIAGLENGRLRSLTVIQEQSEIYLTRQN